MLPGQVFQHAAIAYDTSTAGHDRGAEWAIRQFWSRRDVPFFVPLDISQADPIQVVCEQGRWIAKCPACPSAQLACITDHRFLCTHCLNEHVGGAWIRLEWPAEIDEIERVLRPRQTVNCNWLPGETVADLHAENREHGVVMTS